MDWSRVYVRSIQTAFVVGTVLAYFLDPVT